MTGVGAAVARMAVGEADATVTGDRVGEGEAPPCDPAHAAVISTTMTRKTVHLTGPVCPALEGTESRPAQPAGVR